MTNNNSNFNNTRLTALFPGIPRWAGTRKVKPIWILLKQETVSGSGISWDICKSAPHSRQITTPAPHRSVFYRPDALPAAQPTASKHWRQQFICVLENTNTWILLKQVSVSGSGISWARCKSAHRSRQKIMPAPHHSVFLQAGSLPAAQPTVSKHWWLSQYVSN